LSRGYVHRGYGGALGPACIHDRIYITVGMGGFDGVKEPGDWVQDLCRQGHV
jgi:hypothetical protein